VIPTAMSTTPAGTKTNAVNQTAKPMPIANTPPASHGQALFTREGYPLADQDPFQVHSPTLGHHSVASLGAPGVLTEPEDDLDAIRLVEWLAGNQDPYRQVARCFHVVAQRAQ
jgi:hypothetical protein